MDEASAKPKTLKTCCDACKDKLESMVEEWANNFKMCYCPWKSKTYDIDSESTNNDTTPLLGAKEATKNKEKTTDEGRPSDEKRDDKNEDKVEPTPTLEQLQELNIEPTLWNQLGFFLQLDKDHLSTIGRNSTSTKEALDQMYMMWLEGEPRKVSWVALAQAFTEMDMTNLAAEIRQKHCSSV